MTQITRRCAFFATVSIATGGAGFASAADSSIQAAAPTEATQPLTVEPAAVKALETMSGYLRSLPSFGISATVAKDKVVAAGQKLQFEHDLTVRFARKQGLFIDSESAQRHLQYFYDTKLFTLYTPARQFYATVDAPPTVGATLATAEDNYDISLPLSDIFYWGTDKLPADNIESAYVVGPGRAQGKDCQHYAYRQDGVDWQLCIADGDKPLPLKMVITTIDLPEQPQYMVWMNWDLEPTIEPGSFTFVAPPGASKIQFRPAAEAISAAASK